MPHSHFKMIDNSGLKEHKENYKKITVNLDLILESWKVSLFSFEWLTPDGKIRTPDQLPNKEREKYNTILHAYESGESLERPILGVGVLENVEIGSRRDVLLTLYTLGIKTLDVHVPKSLIKDFTPFQ